jgi:hypothetical protein
MLLPGTGPLPIIDDLVRYERYELKMRFKGVTLKDGSRDRIVPDDLLYYINSTDEYNMSDIQRGEVVTVEHSDVSGERLKVRIGVLPTFQLEHFFVLARLGHLNVIKSLLVRCASGLYTAQRIMTKTVNLIPPSGKTVASTVEMLDFHALASAMNSCMPRSLKKQSSVSEDVVTCEYIDMKGERCKALAVKSMTALGIDGNPIEVKTCCTHRKCKFGYKIVKCAKSVDGVACGKPCRTPLKSSYGVCADCMRLLRGHKAIDIVTPEGAKRLQMSLLKHPDL